MLRLRAGLGALVVAACAAAPPPPLEGTGTLFGALRLVPPQGVTPPPAARSGGGYDDPRLRGARLVDYSRPGFAVVYLEGAAAPPAGARLAIRSTSVATRLEPEGVALAAGGTLVLANETQEAHVVSLPRAGVVERLEPGVRLSIELAEPGAHAVFVLDAGAEALAFAAPGPWAVVDAAGRWQLRNLPPGAALLRAFHPRFPGAEVAVAIAAGERRRIDLEIGAGRRGDGAHASH
jgi:hypothetical protein